MSSGPILGLFSSPAPQRQGSASAVGSIVVHVAICTWLYLGLRNSPRLAVYKPHRYTVRILQAPPLEPPPPVRPALAKASQPSLNATAPASPSSDQLAAAMPSVAERLDQLSPKSQILIQPDAPKELLLQQPSPVPLAFRWTPPPEPVKVIAPAKLKPSIVAKLRPTIEPPNRELRPADVRMSSSNAATMLSALRASTTSPIAVRGPEATAHIPETSSAKAQPQNSAQILSLSDLRAKEGATPVPLANAPARPIASSSLGTGIAVNSSNSPVGHGTGQQAGSGTAQGNTGAIDKGTGTNPGPQTASAVGPSSSGSDSGSTDGIARTLTTVHLPKDGQFGVVVVGSAIAEQYPETVTMWAGRLVYTVYLHLGRGKAWILQYSLPANTVASVSNAIRPEAPWPFDVVQPHLDPGDYTADAVMVHGFVNLSGRFERLNVVFPTQFGPTKFVLSALQQWQFRPARQNGQLAQVEVLLIIPEEGE